MQRCIIACRNCQQQMPKTHPCTLCCYDCEKICDFALNSKLNNIFLDISVLDLCINACNLCILECSKHMAHHGVCKECVDACKACIIECQKEKMDILKDTV
jgi:hypothetical protein